MGFNKYKNNKSGYKKSNYKDYDKSMKDIGSPHGDKQLAQSSMMISRLSMKDLPKSTYSFGSDPYAAKTPESKEYPIITNFNKVFSPSYGGERNLDAGTVIEYASSKLSKFLRAPDVATMPINLKYRYIPMKQNDTVGLRITGEMLNSVREARNILESTTFTSLNFNEYAVITDMPMDGAVSDGDYNGVPIYTSPSEVIFATSIMYQILMQELAHAIDCHNSWRTSQGEMMRMSYERNVAALNGLFGYMNKSAFLNLVESICLDFDGEFVDTDWRIQANTLANIKSRRTEGSTTPLIELETNYVMPDTFKLVIPIYDSEGKIANVETIFDIANRQYECRQYHLAEGVRTSLNIKEVFNGWTSLNSVSNTLRLVRDDTLNASHFYNVCIDHVNAMVKIFDKIKDAFEDYKTAITTLLRPGVVTWSRNFRPVVNRETDYQIPNYILVEHLLKETFSGAAELPFDPSTSRYSSFVLWDKYYGIPEYSRYQGGAFLTFSAKGADSIENSESVQSLPIGFELGSMIDIKTGENKGEGLRLVNRIGEIAYVVRRVVSGATDPDLCRLFPVPQQSSIKMFIPVCPLSAVSGIQDDYSNLHTSTDYVFANHIERVMMDLFGVSEVWYPALEDDSVAAHTSISLSPDILAIYQYQVENLTNKMQTYARANGPFKGVSVDTSGVGFLSLRRS